jgi:hypothetical protein
MTEPRQLSADELAELRVMLEEKRRREWLAEAVRKRAAYAAVVIGGAYLVYDLAADLIAHLVSNIRGQP